MNILADGSYNHAIEKAVTASIGKPFHITGIRENKTGAMHSVAIFEGEN